MSIWFESTIGTLLLVLGGVSGYETARTIYPDNGLACGPSAIPVARRQVGPIEKYVFDAGSGPLEEATPESIKIWLDHHQGVSSEVHQACRKLREHADAAWGNSIDGRICAAEAQSAFYRFTPMAGSGKTYGAGWK